MDALDALARSATEVRTRLAQVPPDAWEAPTPCEGWTVRDLVGHLVGGNQMVPLLVRGGSREDAIALLRGVDLGDDPLATFDASVADQAAAFAEPGALEATLAHPAGDFTGEQVLGFRVGDLTAHAWDLARALAVDEAMDDELVAYVWEGYQPLAPFIGQLGLFGEGPSGDVGEDAPLQERLLDLIGRRP